MKILYVITGLGQGGAERVVCDLADKMYQKGNEVVIAYLTGDILTCPAHEEIELIKINLHSIVTLPVAYLNLSRLIKNYKPDVLHAHMVHANILTRLVRLTTPIKKLICTAHNSDEGGRLRMALYRLTHNLADTTTNVSNTATISFEEKNAVPENGMLTIYNGVNLNNFKYNSSAREEINIEFNLQSNVKVILAVGRFSRQKNYPNLLNAIKILKEKANLPFKLLIAGDGELREYIEKLIDGLNLKDDIILLGRRSDIPKLMSSCDVFVLSSDHEGLPTVLIEAMACQAQVVATDVSGVREIIDIYGEVVPPKNSESLSDAIISAINIPTKNISGAQYVKNKFDLEIISEQWLDKYRK